jgi:HEAT repeat protein
MRLNRMVLGLTFLSLGSIASAQSGRAPKAAPAADPIQALLDGKALQGNYNPVLLEFLTAEGKDKLSAKQREAAVTQLVATFREQVQIKPGEQVAASLATLAGLLAGGTVGSGVREGAAEVWSSWVDSAFILARAGYKAEAASFFERCIQTFPYEHLQARCAAGLAFAEPDRGFELLVKMLGKEQPIEVTNMALRLLGELAGAEGCPQEKKDAVLAELTKKTEGITNASYFEAAVWGLAHTRDPRAVEPLRKLTKGMTKGEEVKRSALRALAVGFQDQPAVEQLQKSLKGGFGKDEADKAYAGLSLIMAGQQSGFDWARDYLGKARKKGFLSSSKDAVDYSAEVASAVIEKGGEPARAVLAAGIAGHKPDEWLSAFLAIGLLDLGDASSIDLVKAALANPDWPRTRVLAAISLDAHGDASGIPVLAAMCKDVSLGKKAVQLAAGSYKDPESARVAVADALGRIDHPEGVPILVELLSDRSEPVRLTAAFGLARMKDPAALVGLTRVLAADFGAFEGRSRNPEVHGHALRSAALSFPGDARATALLETGSKSANASVKFLSLLALRPAAR